MTMVHNRARLRAIAEAGRVLERELVVFDTETTGLDGGAEIVEVSCVNGRGEVLLDTLVRPAGPIPADATAIHGIGYDDVLGKPRPGPFAPCVRVSPAASASSQDSHGGAGSGAGVAPPQRIAYTRSLCRWRVEAACAARQWGLQRRTQMAWAFRSRTSTGREPSPVAGPRHR